MIVVLQRCLQHLVMPSTPVVTLACATTLYGRYMIFFNASYVPEWMLLVGSAWFTALILNDVERGSVEVRWNQANNDVSSRRAHHWLCLAPCTQTGSYETSSKLCYADHFVCLGVWYDQPTLMNAYRANVLQPRAMTAQLNYYRAALAGGSKEARSMAVGSFILPHLWLT